MELSGTRYMIRGLGYLKSLDDLANVPVMAKNGTPVLIRDLGTVAFGPDIRQGVAEWNGEGEVVGGIVVMRDGMNALNVIWPSAGSEPPNVAIVPLLSAFNAEVPKLDCWGILMSVAVGMTIDASKIPRSGKANGTIC